MVPGECCSHVIPSTNQNPLISELWPLLRCKVFLQYNCSLGIVQLGSGCSYTPDFKRVYTPTICILIKLAVLQDRAREVPGTLPKSPMLCTLLWVWVPHVPSAMLHHLPSRWCVPHLMAGHSNTHGFPVGVLWLCISWRNSCKLHSITILLQVLNKACRKST